MCGGVAYKIKNVPAAELKKYYSPELIKRFKTEAQAESFFWYKNAVLPIKDKFGKVQLKLWGNKDKDLKLPKTGWARAESLLDGKWNYLKPEEVKILASHGYEKKTCFEFENGTKGIIVKKDGEERVYMITKKADEIYKKETGHDREPLGKKIKYLK
jgi:hypothetical protein